MRKKGNIPPSGVRIILPTYWYPPDKSKVDSREKIDLELTASHAAAVVAAGHSMIMIAPGSGSGFDIGTQEVIEITKAVSLKLKDKEDLQIWVSCVAGLSQCTEVADAVRHMPNVMGMLVLPNRHPHSDGAGWLEFYKLLGQRMKLPYMLYRVSEARTEAMMTLADYQELAAEDEYFVELKWATEDDAEQLPKIIEALKGDIRVVCGLGDLNGPDWMKRYGVSGWTAYAGNACPYLLKEIENAALEGDFERVQDLNGSLLAFERMRFGKTFVKYNNRLVIAATHRSGRHAYLRPPNAQFSDQDWSSAEKLIAALSEDELAARMRVESGR